MKRMLTSWVVAAALVFGSTAGAWAEDKKVVKGEKAPGVSGVVKKVDDKAGTITIAVVTQKGQPAEDQTFSIAADAKIVVLGQPAKLSEVKTDKPAQLTLNADKKVTALAQADKGAKGVKVAGGPSGVVKKVDDKAGTITLAVVTQKGQPAEDQTFTLAADAKIVVLGQPAKISEIKTDKPAQLTLNTDKKVTVIAQGDKASIKGEKGIGVSGQVKKIDDKANTITIAVVTQKGQPPEEQTFKLTADVKISVLGNPAKLSDVKADMPVQLKLDADKKVLALVQVEKSAGGIGGIVKKIDDKASTITIAIVKTKGQPAEDQTFTLVADAKIVVQGKPAKLSEIEAEKPVSVSLNAEKKVVAVSQGKGQKPEK